MSIATIIDRVAGVPAIWLVIQRVLGYPEDKEAMYRSAVLGMGTLLDFGCASGHLAKAFRDIEYVGVDIDKRSIEAAQKRWSNQANMTWVCADILQRPFGERKFDQALVGCAVHHLSDEQLVPILRALSLCIRPNGTLHIFDPVFQSGDGIGPIMLRKLDRGKYTRSLDQIASAVESTGCFSIENTNILPAPKALWKDCDTGYVKAVRNI